MCLILFFLNFKQDLKNCIAQLQPSQPVNKTGYKTNVFISCCFIYSCVDSCVYLCAYSCVDSCVNSCVDCMRTDLFSLTI